MQHALFIIAPQGFRDEELFEPLKVLQTAGVETTIASKEAGVCVGKLGGTIEAQIGINQINSEDFDALIFIGGPGSHAYFDDPALHLLAQRAIASDKILAAICAASVILAKAGILQDKKATCFPDAQYCKILASEGATVTKAAVEVDGKIITADGPAAATAFGEKILELLQRLAS